MININNKNTTITNINNIHLYDAFKYFNIFRTLFGLSFKNEDLTITYNIIKKNIHERIERTLIKSFINRNISPYQSISYNNFIKYLHKLNKITYRDDTYELKNEILYKTQDKSQIYTVERIIRRKPFTPTYKTLNEIRNNNKPININKVYEPGVWKTCPHCSQRCFRKINTKYVICGYADNSSGYDWKGCSKDWCFKCEKKLCKHWNIDHLYDKNNRYHDKKCCKDMADKNNNNYSEEYCQLMC